MELTLLALLASVLSYTVLAQARQRGSRVVPVPVRVRRS
jgi:hypothetical protein